MPGTEEFKNNPLYSDITRLDNGSPTTVFSYEWNKASGWWEPGGGINVDNLTIDLNETNTILSAISGSLSSTNDAETHRLLSGISGSLSSTNDAETHRLLSIISETLSSSLNSNSKDVETHRLLSGISGQLVSGGDLETHRLLSGVSGSVSNLNFALDNYKTKLKTVNQKIDEDFILLEEIPDSIRIGTYSGYSYGVDRFVIDEVFNTYYTNGRNNPSFPETGHPDYFIHSENTDPNRTSDHRDVFHSDTNYALRFDNENSSPINSYALKEFNDLYQQGLVENITIFNDSPYPIQFHTFESGHSIDLLTLYGGSAVELSNDEAREIYIKRPNTISGYTLKYTITYKEKV